MSRYSEYVEKHVPRPPIVPADWDYVRNEFDDIIDGSIIDGNKEGHDRYPQVRKTIRIKHGGGTLHASEYMRDRKGEAPYVLRFEYDWQYDPGNLEASWKFHYDTYHPEQYWPATKHFHQHDQPNPQKNKSREDVQLFRTGCVRGIGNDPRCTPGFREIAIALIYI